MACGGTRSASRRWSSTGSRSSAWSGTWSGSRASAWPPRPPARARAPVAPVGNRYQRTGRAKAGPRERLCSGMTQAAARYGYREASVARVVEQAGVSRATFYEHFADKEACFLAAFELAAERIELALERIDDCRPVQRAPDLLDDLVENLGQDPAAARILLMEARAGGPPGGRGAAARRGAGG